MRKQIIALTLALLVSLLAACAGGQTSINVQSVGELTGLSGIGAFDICAGVVVAQNEVKIERDASRKIAELMVEVGDSVTAGQVLFTYDTEEMQLAIDKAVLEIEQMKNDITDMTAQIAQLEKEKNAAPESEKLSYTVQIQSMQADIKETKYTITVKERELESLRLNAESGEITSTIDGKVKSITEGDEYSTEPYIVLTQDGAYRVKGRINELNRDDIFVGTQVILRSRIDTSLTWTGTVTEIGTENDLGRSDLSSGGVVYFGGYGGDDTVDSSSYPFYIELSSTEGLLIGQHVYIEPNVGQGNLQGMWLSESFVMGEEGNYWVWAEGSDEKIEKRSISVGAYDELLGSYEIIGGLGAEDYIAFPEEAVREGAPTVRVDTQNGGDLGDDYVIDEEPAYDGGYDAGNGVDTGGISVLPGVVEIPSGG
ncbi:MAG: efflux RND transporter periplasmic adaptor subunit [Oscillospiraceae bacterium]|jgi:HlyD family secretion protein|nr:efflux RND transporter periplasmic adaptor subunit [Oscillospiraceae bacterium]